ncbi:MAG: polyribonucleotide nucleotidyltransferase, partial [Rhodospirillales bacterium]
MVESEAQVLSEQTMLGAVVFGHEQMQTAIAAIQELASEAGKPAWEWAPPEVDPALIEAVAAQAESGLIEAYTIKDKQERYAKIGDIKAAAVETLSGGEGAAWKGDAVGGQFGKLESR